MDIKESKDKILEPMWDSKDSQLRHNEFQDKEEEIKLKFYFECEVYL